MKQITRFLSVFAILASAVCARAADRITYDRQCLTIDGRDTFVFSGAFHYFRCPKELWRDRFAKMKAAGLNTVETYVAWNWHEPLMPASLDDYSKMDLTDLTDWLTMAEDEFGLNVIVRAGPYICAEWDGGGYPQWLLTKKPQDYQGQMWLRGDEKNYLAWCKHWWDAVAKATVPHEITHRAAGKAGVILWQLENEYDYAAQPGDVKFNQLRALAHWSRDAGIDVPMITCVTHRPNFREDPYLREQVIETQNEYPQYGMAGMRRNLAQLREYQPDKFGMITELQGGWFSRVGGSLSSAQGYGPAQINHITLLAMESGLTSLNYYMFFGGTNFGDGAAKNITMTYDYDAPLREPGGVGERYAAVSAIGHMLKEHGERLTRAELVPCEVVGQPPADVSFAVRQAKDGSRYIFVRTEQRDGPRHEEVTLRTKQADGEEIHVAYDLPPFGAKILYLPRSGEKEWLPKEAPPLPARPDEKDLPAPIVIKDATWRDEPWPTNFRPMIAEQTLEDLGVFDSRFVVYQAAIGETPPDSVLAVDVPPGDGVAALAGGKTLAAAPGKRTVRFAFPSGEFRGPIQLLYENSGHANGGGDMEQRKGIRSVSIVPHASASKELGGWRILDLPDGVNLSDYKGKPEVSAEFDASAWREVSVDDSEGKMRRNRQNSIYRCTFDTTDAQLAAAPWRVEFGRIDDEGWVFLNGQEVGHTTDWSHPQAIDLREKLHPGKNTLAVLVHNNDGPGGLARGVTLEPLASAGHILDKLQVCTDLISAAEQWWKESLNDSSWQKTSLGNDPGKRSDTLLRWYRLRFAIPATDSKVWAPWKIRLDASGNGFVYLNGRPLGRYWQVGPQREFYLPECWLHVGDGKENVLTMSLRATDAAPKLRSAEVSVYREYAEKR